MTGGPPERPPGASVDPARGDRVLVGALLLLLAVAASASPIRNYDYWWHLATGRWIVEQRAVPRVDPFSFTAAGRTWVDHEWLFQVLAYLGHRSLGPAALCLLKVVAVVGLGRLFAVHLRREGHAPAAIAAILAPAFLGASFRLDVRPELVTLLLVPLALHLALLARDTGRARLLLALPALAALGANLHPGILFLPAALAAGSAATFVTERRAAAGAPERRPRFAPRLAAAAAACGLGIGLNPYGLAIYAVPFEVSSVLTSIPSPNLEWQRPLPAQFPLFFAAAAGAVAILALGRRRIDPVTAPALFLALVLGAAHLRNLGLFFLLLPHGVARPAGALATALPRMRTLLPALPARVRPGFVAAVVLLVASVPLLALLPPGVVWGLGIASDNEPAAAADFLDREGVGRRLFNDVRFGGYLIWRRYPAHPVFIDGRNEIYGDLMRDLFAAMRDPDDWRRFLDRHGIDAAFLRYPPNLQKVLYPRGPGRPPVAAERAFSAAYFNSAEWALVYWDDDAMIFVRRSPGYRSVIERLEYRAINPDDWRYQYAAVMAGDRPIGPILAELDRKLAEDPGCRRARRLLRAFSGLRRGPGRDAAPRGADGG